MFQALSGLAGSYLGLTGCETAVRDVLASCDCFASSALLYNSCVVRRAFAYHITPGTALQAWPHNDRAVRTATHLLYSLMWVSRFVVVNVGVGDEVVMGARVKELRSMLRHFDWVMNQAQLYQQVEILFHSLAALASVYRCLVSMFPNNSCPLAGTWFECEGDVHVRRVLSAYA